MHIHIYICAYVCVRGACVCCVYRQKVRNNKVELCMCLSLLLPQLSLSLLGACAHTRALSRCLFFPLALIRSRSLPRACLCDCMCVAKGNSQERMRAKKMYIGSLPLACNVTFSLALAFALSLTLGLCTCMYREGNAYSYVYTYIKMYI